MNGRNRCHYKIPSGADNIRAFIAIELPGAVRKALGELIQRLRADGLPLRWVRPDNIHLTLKFLGDIPPGQAAAVGDAVAAAVAGMAPFQLRAAGVGVFPSLARARVIWVGAAGGVESLNTLHQQIDGALKQLGFAGDERPFKGHLTLGRAKGRLDPERLKRSLKAAGAFDAGAFPVIRLTLFKSDLKPFGAVYTPLREMAFGEADSSE